MMLQMHCWQRTKYRIILNSYSLVIREFIPGLQFPMIPRLSHFHIPRNEHVQIPSKTGTAVTTNRAVSWWQVSDGEICR